MMLIEGKFMERYIWVGAVFMFFFGGAYFTILYYLPIYFQSDHNASPTKSSVNMLALIIPLTLATVVQGAALSKIRTVLLFCIVGGALGAVGCGLFYALDTDTSTGKWIGYQTLVGFTTGWGLNTGHQCPRDRPVSRARDRCDPNPGSIYTCASHVCCRYIVGLRTVFAITIAAFGMSSVIGFLGNWKKLDVGNLKEVCGRCSMSNFVLCRSVAETVYALSGCWLRRREDGFQQALL